MEIYFKSQILILTNILCFKIKEISTKNTKNFSNFIKFNGDINRTRNRVNFNNFHHDGERIDKKNFCD